MGQLVFQATLGGQVNLVGPNTASTYNINVPAVAGTMVTTGDTGTVSSTMLASSLSLTTPNIGVATGTSLKVSAGFYSTSSSSFTYTDGIVMDYTTGLGRISVGASDGVAFYNGGVATTELMRIDASGNVGIGVTPKAWSTLSPGLDVGVCAGIASFSNQAALTYNTYFNGINWVYKTSYYASAYRQLDGNHVWEGAVSGTAGTIAILNERMRLDTSGNLLVGTTTMQSNPGGASVNAIFNSGIVVGGGGGGVRSAWTSDRINFSTTNFYVLNGSNTGVVLPNGNTSWGSQSDERTKDIIEPITNAAEKVSTLRAVIGKYKTDEDSKRRSFLIAQDVQAVLPEAVTALDDEQNTLVLAYTETIPLLVAAIQEQQALITSLTERIAALETSKV